MLNVNLFADVGSRGLVAGLALVFIGSGAMSMPVYGGIGWWQDADPGEVAKVDEEKQDQADASGDGEPTLDDLLGLGDGEEGGDGEAGLPDVGEALDGEGAEGPPTAKLFMDALKAMNASATRLLDRQDPGLVTQRHQEDVLLNLTMLIKQAAQQQKAPPSGSPKPQEKKPKPGEQQQSQPSPKPGDKAAEQDSRPPGRDADLEGEIAEGRSEWGNLPARVRDLLLQGRSESSASLYRRLTELYYKRLAEESEKEDQ